MFLYTSAFTYQDGTPFPNTAAINSTGPATKDGTEFIKSYVDDSWGFRQAVMDMTNLTPNASAEAQGTTGGIPNSQLVTALRRITGHPGEIVAWMGWDKDPSSVDVRLMQCNGQVIDITTATATGEVVYGQLLASCWVGAPDNPTAIAFYRSSDAGGAVRSATGNYMKLPDLRGVAIRGYDPGATRDPEGGSRLWGELQGFAVEDHEHNGIATTSGNGLAIAGIQSGASFNGFYDDALTAPSASKLKTTDPSTGTTSAAETRMTNVAAVWCVRY